MNVFLQDFRYYNDVDAYVAVFSVTDRSSFYQAVDVLHALSKVGSSCGLSFPAPLQFLFQHLSSRKTLKFSGKQKLTFLQEEKVNSPIILVANKADLVRSREVGLQGRSRDVMPAVSFSITQHSCSTDI